MDTKTLQGLSKDELIKIIEELQLKEALHAKGIQGPEVDYRYLVESASDIIFILDEQGNLVYCNKAWENLFPHKGGPIIGTHYSAAVPAIEIGRATAVFESVIKGDQEIQNEKFKTYDKDGNVVYLLANLMPMRSEKGASGGLFGFFRNITDIHLMESKLRENSRRLEEMLREQIERADELKRLTALNDEIINNAPIGIFTMDPVSGVVLSENPAIKVIIGASPDKSIVGTNFKDLPGLARTDFKKVIDEVFLQKKLRFIKNTKYSPTESPEDERTLNLRIIPILDSERKLKSVMVMVEDVTEQMRIGDRMHRAEQLSAMGLLAAGVAYELKMPLNLMTVDLNFVENNIAEDSPMRDYVNSMKDELSRMKQISEHLLNLSKPEDSEQEVFEAHKLITSHPIQITLNRLQKNGFNVVTHYSDNTVKIRAIKNQLVQVLLHLIANAEEAMPEKGTLRISVDTLETANGPYASISIEDTGIGISKENIKKIFQPFFTTKGEKSTGLGLMVTYSTIETLGGTIGVKSKPGEGTTFRIVLPGVRE